MATGYIVSFVKQQHLISLLLKASFLSLLQP